MLSARLLRHWRRLIRVGALAALCLALLGGGAGLVVRQTMGLPVWVTQRLDPVRPRAWEVPCEHARSLVLVLDGQGWTIEDLTINFRTERCIVRAWAPREPM